MELPDESFWGEAQPQVSHGVFKLPWFSDYGLKQAFGIRFEGRQQGSLRSRVS